YHETIVARGAHIIREPTTMEWGLREMIVEVPDGHKIRFGQNVPSTIHHSQPGLGTSVRIRVTPLHAGEHSCIFEAEDISGGQIVGSVSCWNQDNKFFYIKNLLVAEEFRGKGIGKALMQALTHWLNEHAAHKSSVYLHAPESLAGFYKQ